MPRPLVLLHGFTQTGASWDGVRAALGGERYRPILAPDLRGHGTAAAARPADIPGVLADINALLGDGATLAGYSMGGRLALLFALAHPERVERLVVVSASAGIADPHERAERKRADDALAGDLEAHGIDAFADRWASLPLWAGQSKMTQRRADVIRRAQNPQGLAASLRGCGTGVMEPVWGRLHELTMPGTFAAGERDARYVALAAQMAVATPSATTAVIPNAGHAVPLEAPADVAALLG